MSALSHKDAVVKILCVQPLPNANVDDLWLAIGEIRKLCVLSLMELPEKPSRQAVKDSHNPFKP